MAGILRKLRCDLRANRLQRVSIIILVALAVAALSTSLNIQQRGGTAWEQLFRETNGAHVWFYGDEERVAEVVERDGVVASTDVYPAARARIAGVPHPQGLYPLWLEGVGLELPEIGAPLLTSGRWLRGDGEVVLPRRFANENGLESGDALVAEAQGGQTVELRVVGLAVFAGRSPYALPTVAWTTPGTLTGAFSPDFAGVGIQLAHRGQTRAFLDALDLDPVSPNFFFAEDWNGVRAQDDEATQVIATFLGIFSLFGLAAAAFVIVNAISGRVLARYRDIGLMKAVGFTPRQVTAGLLIEQLGAAVVAVVAGLLLGRLLAPVIDGDASGEFATESLGYFRWGIAAAITAGVLVLVTVATLVPAWRAGRVPTVQAIVFGPGRLVSRPSRAGAVASALKLPSWAVVGVKDAFDRPVRAWFTVAALVLSVVTVTFVFTTEWTIRQLVERPELIGEPFELAVEADDPADLDRIQAAIEADPRVTAWFERGTLTITPDGKEEEVTLAALGPGYEQVDWVISRGRLFSAPGEATVGKGFLDLMGANIGDTVTLTVLGEPLEITIVGMYRATEDGGRWAMTSVETARQVNPDLRVDGFAIAFEGHEATRADVERYREAGANSIEHFDHGADGVTAVRGVLGGLGLMLLAVGLVSLVNSISLGVRERRRDLGILKAIGFSPRQLVGSVVTGALATTAIALAIGIPLGLWVSDRVSDLIGNNMGWGPGLLETAPFAWVMGVAVLVAGSAALAALAPALLAARTRPSEALRAE